VSDDARVRVLGEDGAPELDIVEGGGTAHAIVWPGVGAQLRSMHRIRLTPGAATVALTHPGDAVYTIIEGAGTAHDDGEGASHELVTGTMIHIDGGTTYRIVAGDDGLDVVGGPAPADPALYAGLER
jgi:quercetin dioxygenase-like cupin family protein